MTHIKPQMWINRFLSLWSACRLLFSIAICCRSSMAGITASQFVRTRAWLLTTILLQICNRNLHGQVLIRLVINNNLRRFHSYEGPFSSLRFSLSLSLSLSRCLRLCRLFNTFVGTSSPACAQLAFTAWVHTPHGTGPGELFLLLFRTGFGSPIRS